MKNALVLALVSVASASQAQDNAVGITFTGQTYKVDVNNGVGAPWVATGLTGTNCLAFYSSGWYTVDIAGQLWRIQSNGSLNLVYQLQLGGATDVRALAFDAGGKMFAVVNKTASDELWAIDPVSGVGTLAGPMGSTTVQGLAVSTTGRMYAYDVSTALTGGLLLVDRATGATTDLDHASPGQSGIQDLFPSAGTIGGGRDSLFVLDPNSGSEFLLGSGGYSDVRGWARRQTVSEIDATVVKLGKLVQGGASSLLHRDGNMIRVDKFFVPNATVPPVNVEVEFDNGLDPSTVLSTGFHWTGNVTTSGSFRLTLEVFNRQTSLWETLVATTVRQTETDRNASMAGSMSAYADANGRVLTRYTVKPTGPIGSLGWGVLCDMFRMEQIAPF
ncbi:MAG: hypothetical protein JST30_15995 [Armatimonadetes bacterium]|nr:hypothetical protein [Armatimonadota bacterium]